jgi:membrane protein YqaA with SNARE-associated domain
MVRTSESGNKNTFAQRGASPRWVRWICGAPGVALAFVWGLAEATFFFVVPDVIISLAAMLRPRRALNHLVASLAGALLGGLCMFLWGAHDAKDAVQAVSRVPFITHAMIQHVEVSYQRQGMVALLLGPLSGTPYKIYAVEAPRFQSLAGFLLVTIPARGERFVLVLLASAGLGVLLRRIGRPEARFAIWHAAIWIVFYALYWSRIIAK